MTFADTSGYFATLIHTDANHQRAVEWVAANRGPIITTDYIIDETLTLLRTKGHGDKAASWGEGMFAGRGGVIHYLTEAEIAAAWGVFQRFRDKNWSFTDCTSKVIIDSFGIPQAFAFDHHFRQFGTVAVAP